MGTEKRERQKANRALKQQQIEQQASRRKTLRTVGIVVAAIVGVFALVWVASNFVGDDDEPTTPVPAVTTVPTSPGTTPPATTPATTPTTDG